MDHLVSHRWPGNVRELENAIERGVAVGRGEILAAADLPRGAGTPGLRGSGEGRFGGGRPHARRHSAGTGRGNARDLRAALHRAGARRIEPTIAPAPPPSSASIAPRSINVCTAWGFQPRGVLEHGCAGLHTRPPHVPPRSHRGALLGALAVLSAACSGNSNLFQEADKATNQNPPNYVLAQKLLDQVLEQTAGDTSPAALHDRRTALYQRAQITKTWGC